MPKSLFILGKLIIFVTMLVTGSSLEAQFITPPLDPSVRIRMPAPASWRYVKAKNATDSETYASVAYGAYSSESSKQNETLAWNSSQTSLLMLAKTGQVNIEAYYEPKTQTDNSHTFSKSTCFFILNRYNCFKAGDKYKTLEQFTESQFNVAYLKGSTSYGGFARTTESKINDAQPVKKTSLGVNLVKQMAQVFFVGFGYEKVREAEADKPQNHWYALTWGGSMMAGKPDETQLRLEYGLNRSTQAVAEGKNKYDVNIHPETDELLVAAEIKIGALLISYKTETLIKRKYPDPRNNSFDILESTLKINKIGLGKADKDGLLFSAYFSNLKYSSKADTLHEPKGTALNLNLGFNF